MKEKERLASPRLSLCSLMFLYDGFFFEHQTASAGSSNLNKTWVNSSFFVYNRQRGSAVQHADHHELDGDMIYMACAIA